MKTQKIKLLILRNIYWILLKFKKEYSSIDYEGDYATLVKGKVLFGDMYITQTVHFYKGKRVFPPSKLQKSDLFPDPKEVFNPWEAINELKRI